MERVPDQRHPSSYTGQHSFSNYLLQVSILQSYIVYISNPAGFPSVDHYGFESESKWLVIHQYTSDGLLQSETLQPKYHSGVA